MKRIFSFILVMMAISLPMIADNSGSQSKTPVALDYHQINDDPSPTIHRSPMRICIDAYYDAFSRTITIGYVGEATGEVHLYRDDLLIEYSNEINTTFMVLESGCYTIEIVTDSWSAIGNIDI
ncbi:MAG: hypothetical protein K2L45_10065 [Muribaculaceae bacterium]|nr:hypothetical protein [Muribaculaceae bacterium]MDE6631663.1 hypothetical protein [Muribaculaceae bacterium]